MMPVGKGVLGAVLAGGRSSRFGSDKALALANGKALLDHAIETLRHVTTHVVVCGRAWPGAVTVTDRPASDMGPLAGLNAALHYARSNGFNWVLSLACDTPFVAPALLSDIAARRQATFVEQHPVIALWPAHAGAALDQMLASNGRHSLRVFAQAIGAVPLAVTDAIANFNFAQDLDQWLAASRAPGVESPLPRKSERIAFVDALATIRTAIAPGPCETVPTAIANGRVLAQTAVARRDCPPFAMAAMDGYAISEAMIAAPGERHLKIGHAQFAGEPMRPLSPGEARPIYTGAAVPSGTGAVLVQEHARVAGHDLILSETLASGANIRRAGEDARAEEPVLTAPARLNPAMIGALSAYGIAEATVRKRPSVAMLVIGDELADAGSAAPEQVIDANGPMVCALLAEAGCSIAPSIGVRDEEPAIRAAIAAVLEAGADMIVSTGGASVGARDLLRPALEAAGAAIHFHGAHMRPGKPVLFATIGEGVPIFGLPGNPVAALVGARFFIMAALRAWYGLPPELATKVWPDRRNGGPTRVLKACARRDATHEEPYVLPGQQSHRLRPLLDADVWLIKGGDEPACVFPLFDSIF